MMGTCIRDYRIVTEIGSGGMGTVYYAEHQLIGRRAAIKVLNPAIASNGEIVSRFFNEARAVNAIRHPNIVDVTDFGQVGEAYFLIMEFLEGETLGSRLERLRRLEPVTAIPILIQVASAVGAVHERGIVHRDLKPENIFLCNHPDYPDFAKVLDFGIVKLVGTPTGDAKSTMPGMTLGTPAYMSPEQWAGDESLDHRSDIYSLGVVAYEMLAGAQPFTGTPREQLDGHLNRMPPSLRMRNPAVSDALEAVIFRMMAKEPEARFGSMREVREHLKAILLGAPLPLSSPARAATTHAMAVESAAEESKPSHRAARWAAVVENNQTVLVGAKLRAIISKRISQNQLQLPSLPTVPSRCLELLRDEDASFTKVAETIEQDPLLASRVLRIVNSPFYGTRGKIVSMEAAVSRLGIAPLRRLLQELSAREVFTSRNPRIRAAFQGVWTHCLAVATLSRELALALRSPDAEAAYLAGLFHDIGKPVVAVLLLEAERTLLEESGGEWMSESVWLKVVNACHRDVGYSLARRWNLPEVVADAIGRLDAYDYKAAPTACVNIVRFANAVTKREGFQAGEVDLDALLGEIVQGRRLLGLDEELEQRLVKALHLRFDGDGAPFDDPVASGATQPSRVGRRSTG